MEAQIRNICMILGKCFHNSPLLLLPLEKFTSGFKKQGQRSLWQQNLLLRYPYPLHLIIAKTKSVRILCILVFLTLLWKNLNQILTIWRTNCVSFYVIWTREKESGMDTCVQGRTWLFLNFRMLGYASKFRQRYLDTPHRITKYYSLIPKKIEHNNFLMHLIKKYYSL